LDSKEKQPIFHFGFGDQCLVISRFVISSTVTAIIICSQMFSVVTFQSDNSVQLVPTNWLSSTKKQCRWPVGPQKGISSIISKNKPPGKNWPFVTIKLLKETGEHNFITNFTYD